MPISSEDPWPWKEPASLVPRGAFIVIEGLDRAGKTTQVKRLCDKLYFQGHNIKTIRFPGKLQLFTVENKFFFEYLALKDLLSNRPVISNWQNDRQLSPKPNRNG
jgi:hypothetical protein